MKMLKLVFTLGLGTIALLFVACGANSPKDVAIAFTKDASKGNGDRLIKYIHLPQMETDATKEIVKGKFKTAAAKAESKAEAFGGLDEVKAIPECIEEQRAIIKVFVRFKNGSVDTDTIELIKVDNEWKVIL